MDRPAPKFQKWNPAIIESKDCPEFNGTRVMIASEPFWAKGSDDVEGWAYHTMPNSPRQNGWMESALRPLPDEDLKGCFEIAEIPITIKVEIVK